jgi:hypothetical protein
MSDKLRHRDIVNYANVPETFDKVTNERTFAPTAIFWEDDFISAGRVSFSTTAQPGQDWIAKNQGTPTTVMAAAIGAVYGQVTGALAATSEKEETTLTWNDNLSLNLLTGLVFESRVKLSVLPSAAGVQAFWGLSSAYQANGPDNASYYVEFGATANGTILMRSQDQVTQNAIATTLTVATTDFHIYRIDCSNPLDIGFFIDGVQYNTPGQIKFTATGANAQMQATFGIYKPSGTGLCTIFSDYVRCYCNRA